MAKTSDQLPGVAGTPYFQTPEEIFIAMRPIMLHKELYEKLAAQITMTKLALLLIDMPMMAVLGACQKTRGIKAANAMLGAIPNDGSARSNRTAVLEAKLMDEAIASNELDIGRALGERAAARYPAKSLGHERITLKLKQLGRMTMPVAKSGEVGRPASLQNYALISPSPEVTLEVGTEFLAFLDTKAGEDLARMHPSSL